MASKSEMESERRADIKYWRERVIHTMQDYNLAKKGGTERLPARALAFGTLKSLAREKVDFGYSLDDIDPDGVAGFSKEDMQIMQDLCEKVEAEREEER